MNFLWKTCPCASFSAFSRCENGKTKPLLALVKLLKVLDRPPDLLAEVRAG
jgi:HTH-type transcriptional regulator/antitoxin MqsA